MLLCFNLQILRLQRLKKKQKALQARLDGPPQNLSNSVDLQTECNSNKIETKRRNPFAGYRIMLLCIVLYLINFLVNITFSIIQNTKC